MSVKQSATVRAHIASEVAPASGVPTLRSASGRARPTFGRMSAVARAASVATSAAARHAVLPRFPVVDPSLQFLDERQQRVEHRLVPRGGTAELHQRVISVAHASRHAPPNPAGRGRPSRAPSALSIAPHSTPDVPPAFAAHSLPAAVSTEPAPAPSVTARAAASRAADEPLTMPRPWSPSPAIASIRPNSSSASASISAIASKARATSLRAGAAVVIRQLGELPLWPPRPPRPHRSERSPAGCAADVAPLRYAGVSAGAVQYFSSSSSSHITSANNPAMSRLVTSSPTSGSTIVVPTVAQQPRHRAPHHEQLLVLGAAKSIEDHCDSL